MAPTLPVTIGHEFSGRVVQHGKGVTEPAIGQLVTVRPSVTCGQCSACINGQPDDCVTRKGVGVGRDEVVEFMARHQSLLECMVTHKVPLSDAMQGFALARNKTATKVMVVPDPASAEAAC